MADLDRFKTSRSTLLVDRFMTSFIKVGGLAIIAAVFAIFVFILVEIMPLFRQARIEPAGTRQGPAAPSLAFGVDEWGELPFTLTGDGVFHFMPAQGSGTTFALPLASGERVTTADYDQKSQTIAIGTSAGRAIQAAMNYASSRPKDGGKSVVTANPEVLADLQVGAPGAAITSIGMGEDSDRRLVATLQDRRAFATAFTVEDGKASKLWEQELGTFLGSAPQRLLVDDRAEHIVVSDASGSVIVLATGETGATVFQEAFRPFAGLADPAIASIDYLFGDVSLVMTSPSGANRVFSLYIDPARKGRQYGPTKDLDQLAGGAAAYAKSIRNKAFLLADGDEVSLRFATSATVRWQGKVGFQVGAVALSGKYDHMFLLDQAGGVHTYTLDDPHPEAGLRAFFGKVWYEGGDAPEYSWQSSGSTDDFEPKLSLIPLIVGTLKGTLYAMLFAVPIALFGAIYTAEFMHPRFKVFVKPTIEVMASLPSVVLGFLAALWLAPLIDQRVPSVLCCVIGLPASAMLFGWAWTSMPDRIRSRIRPGYEFLAYLPVMLAALFACWHLGGPIESALFAGDFRTWWPKATGASYEQRNSLVVGFMMGFAVIPILFTIVEDALTNVPANLRTGSLALGASRWQTATRVVLPTASAGILSALMIGLGRAIGETMIVVMATGNTPIMDLNIFSGMRTLSANIAVELPEAPHGGTLYRTLFLGAMLLFLMTFLVNTLAEVLRQHLREKYKTV